MSILKAPFPYFGGKGMIAKTVWKYLGDVKQYIEPFFGSGAVLLQRPLPSKHEKYYEIVNDKDGHICNVWRSIQFNPDETAKWCCWPINHADLMARKKSLISNEDRLLENLCNDPDWHDPKLAGYWIWSASCWIGSGMMCPTQIPHLTGDSGVFSTTKIPHLTGDRGVFSTTQRPHLTHDQGVFSTTQRPHLTHDQGVYEWFRSLSQRLRNVKVVCGNWTRVCGGNWQANNKPCGMFFDPPYATETRSKNIYRHDSQTIGKEVEKWVLERGKNKDYRIVVAGYDDEYQTLIDSGWKVEAWKANGGYGNLGNGVGKENRLRERLFISPHCVGNDNDLFHKRPVPLRKERL
jgi:site-specific DNA-adenine methylase